MSKITEVTLSMCFYTYSVHLNTSECPRRSFLGCLTFVRVYSREARLKLVHFHIRSSSRLTVSSTALETFHTGKLCWGHPPMETVFQRSKFWVKELSSLLTSRGLAWEVTACYSVEKLQNCHSWKQRFCRDCPLMWALCL